MRPKVLKPLYNNVQNISGFGPYYSSLVKNLVGDRYKDLILHIPSSIIKRILVNNIEETHLNKKIIFTGTITSIWTSFKKPKISTATIKLNKTNISIIYFNVKKNWFNSIYVKNKLVTVSGTLQIRNNKLQIVHPDYVITNNNTVPLYESIYPLTQGLNKNKLRNAIFEAVQTLPSFNEWIDTKLVNHKKWPQFTKAIKSIHFPQSQHDIDIYPLFIERLAYD